MYKIKPFQVLIPQRQHSKSKKHFDIMKMAEELLLSKDADDSSLNRLGRYSRVKRSTNTLRTILNDIHRDGNTSLNSIDKQHILPAKTPNQ